MQHKVKIAAIVLGVLVLVIGVGLLLKWPYSPLNKTIAWVSLKSGNFQSEQVAAGYVHTLINGQEFAPELKEKLWNLEVSEQIVEIGEKAIPFTSNMADDEHFLAGKTYSFPFGQDGINERESRVLLVEGKESVRYEVDGRILRLPIDQVIYAGKRSQEDVTKVLQEKWSALVTALKKKKGDGVDSLVSAAEVEQFSKTTKLSDMDYRVAPTAQIAFAVGAETNDSIQIGTLTIKQKSCMKAGEISIVYLKDQQGYRFDGVYAALSSICAKPKEITPTLKCSNCWLAPVGKKQGLPSSYAPYVVASGLSGGTYMTPDTKTALTKLFADAKANGITTIRVSSGYRSYTWQDSLFNTYVNNEKKYGLTTAQATEKANTYSAKPGHSEHQLGTTVDLMACKSPCSFYDSANNPLFTYLNANAHKFGFIISYPNGSQPFTGYVYEPWHVRYVGTDLANELYNHGYLTKKGYYLEQFLREKGKY